MKGGGQLPPSAPLNPPLIAVGLSKFEFACVTVPKSQIEVHYNDPYESLPCVTCKFLLSTIEKPTETSGVQVPYFAFHTLALTPPLQGPSDKLFSCINKVLINYSAQREKLPWKISNFSPVTETFNST